MELHRFEYNVLNDLPMEIVTERALNMANGIMDLYHYNYTGNWCLHLVSQSNTNTGRTFLFVIYEEARQDDHEQAVEATKENRMTLDRLKKENV